MTKYIAVKKQPENGQIVWPEILPDGFDMPAGYKKITKAEYEKTVDGLENPAENPAFDGFAEAYEAAKSAMAKGEASQQQVLFVASPSLDTFENVK